MTKLVPYPSNEMAKPGDPTHAQGPAGLTLEADARLAKPEGPGEQRKLILTYSAGGALNQILWPASLSSQPQRRDELWKHTCFEAFIKPVGQDRYWEINISPAGDWNVYRFTSYRNEMTREEAVQALHPIFTRNGDQWRLSYEIWVPAWAVATELEVGLTSVIEDTSGEISYWAIHHAGAQPDFHLANSFTKRIGGG
jgi:hypothetical protein